MTGEHINLVVVNKKSQWSHCLKNFPMSVFQNEREQIMTTNCWLTQVSVKAPSHYFLFVCFRGSDQLKNLTIRV